MSKRISNGRCHRKHPNLQTQYGYADHLLERALMKSMAYALIGGTAVGTVLTLAFLPALYAIWFRVSYVERNHTGHRQSDDPH